MGTISDPTEQLPQPPILPNNILPGIFPFEELLPELQGEVFPFLNNADRLLLALCSNLQARPWPGQDHSASYRSLRSTFLASRLLFVLGKE